MRKALYFLGILNDADIDWLVAAGTRREIGSGTRLIEEGKATNSVYLVVSGAFSVRTSVTGNREFARLMAGEVMGEMSFVDNSVPSASVVALEKSFVLEVPKRRLNAKLAEDTEFSARFYRAISMFLASRLRSAMVATSGGDAGHDAEQMGFDTLDQVSMAGARFDWVLRRLRSE